MTCGLLPTWTWDKSSVKVTSRTQCRPFSICQWPRIQAASSSGRAWSWQVADRVHGVGAPLTVSPGPGGDRAGASGDLGGLAGVGELDPGGESDDLEGADLPTSVPGLDAAVGGLDIPPRERGELMPEAGLVALRPEHPVRAAAVQLLDVVALGVQGVDGDHGAGQVRAAESVEQRRERGDLVGLAVDIDLPQDGAGVVVDRREQVPTRAGGPAGVCVPGAPHGLAVHPS